MYVICDHDVCARAGWSVVDFADACLQGGARLLQIRAKQVSGREFLSIAERVVARARHSNALVIVNDRADVARIAGAGGVHVGQEDLAPALVRTIVGPDAIIGLSTHTPEQVDAALTQPINHVAVGPVFGTNTKETGYDAVGLQRVKDAARLATPAGLDVVAIGGITLDRARSVLDAGAHAVAVISDLLVTRDPTERVRQFLAALPPSNS